MTREPVATDLLAGLGGAAVLAAVFAATRGDTAGLAVGGLAVGGLLARVGPAPVLVLLATVYFAVYPGGLPVGAPQGDGGVAAGPRVLDLLAAAGLVAYSGGHYRRLRRDADGAGEPPPDDVAWLAGGAAAAAVGGWLTLRLVTRYRPDYGGRPLRLVSALDQTDEYQVGFARFLLLTGVLGGGVGLATLGLWLARLNRLTADEARQVLLDTGWREGRREFARVETWRAARRRPPPRPGGRVRRLALVAFGSFLLFLVLLGMWQN